jgi:hypothetical protein
VSLLSAASPHPTPPTCRVCWQRSAITPGQSSGQTPNRVATNSSLYERITEQADGRGWGRHDRSIHGSIPSAIGQLAALDWLKVSNNQLTGTLPSELGQLGLLQAMYVDRNQLSGPLPAQMAAMRSLAELKVAGNVRLCGPLPEIRYKHAVDVAGTRVGSACAQLPHSEL